MLLLAFLAVFPLCLIWAATSDLMTMTIPNRLSLLLAIGAIGANVVAGSGFVDIGFDVAAGLLVFLFCLCLFAAGVMGGGDAKLLTACALWYGLNGSLLAFLLYVSVLGGVLTVLVVMLRSWQHVLLAAGIPMPGLLLTAKKIPYAIAIAAGALLAFPASPLYRVALAQIGI
ncbi:prepilin peptidase [Ensifer sp. LC163]|uniref:A24 family peptidase n=1 Tax=Ensifer sp. LC163 TaxID=1120652 RepID=UPI000812D5B9|nr:prepilin peptidase [Ensifer sp. LC163]OCP34464.1 peptidase [Ensifer sp. LC163]